MLKGLDNYGLNSPLDYKQLKNDGFAFVICKATEGYTFHDAKFAEHYKAAIDAGLVAGAYCFSRPGSSTPEQEVNSLVASVEDAGGFMLPPALDIEDDGGLNNEKLGAYVTQWKEAIQKHDSRKPILYLNMDFYNRLKPYIDGWMIWISEPDVNKPSIEGWTFWQSTFTGREQGGTYDFDYFNGDFNDLEAITKKITLTLQTVVKPAQAPQTPAYKEDNAFHVIKSGETLTQIALNYHVPLNVLAKYNLLSNPDLIKVGNTLRIPKAIEVRAGDTVSDIALRRNESTSVIGYVNGLANVSKIYIGQTLWV